MNQNLRSVAFVLAVADIDRSSAYYRDVLGFIVKWADGPDWRWVERDGVRIMLGQCPTDRPASELGSHNWFGYIELEDIEAFYAEISGKGAISTAPKTQSYGLSEIVVTTIDGHRIVFGQTMKPQ